MAADPRDHASPGGSIDRHLTLLPPASGKHPADQRRRTREGDKTSPLHVSPVSAPTLAWLPTPFATTLRRRLDRRNFDHLPRIIWQTLLTAPPILERGKKIYADQANALIEGGADPLMIETVIDVRCAP